MGNQYVFTWASTRGPEVERFDNADSLLAFAAGWTNSASDAGRLEALLIVRRGRGSIEVRA